MLNDGMDLDPLNITNIQLIPKCSHPTNMVNFRPINLCDVLYKLITKMIVFRLKDVLELCIDKDQSVFVLGGLIFNNVLIAYEILLFLTKMNREKGTHGFKIRYD